jgi:hypothetical protein
MPKLVHQSSNPVKSTAKQSDIDSGMQRENANTAKKTNKAVSKGQPNKKNSLTIELNAESVKGSCS